MQATLPARAKLVLHLSLRIFSSCSALSDYRYTLPLPFHIVEQSTSYPAALSELHTANKLSIWIQDQARISILSPSLSKMHRWRR